MTVVAILFSALVTVLVCVVIGVRAVRPYVEPTDSSTYLLGFLIGAACLSTLVFWVCVLRVAFWQTFAGIALASLFLGFRGKPLAYARGSVTSVVYACVFGAFGLFYFLHALKPEASPDGATYHLGLVARYLREHGFGSTPENLYAGFPKGMEMLFLFAFAFGKHSAAALVHYAFLIVLGMSLFVFARRAGFRAAGICASLLVFLSPAMGMNGTTAYVDAGLAATAFGTFWLIEMWRGSRLPKLLLLIGSLAGFSFAIKYTGMVVVAYAAFAVALQAKKNQQSSARAVAIVLASAAVISAPYLVYNWMIRGNPVFPFLNAIFPNPFVHISFERMASAMMHKYPGLASYWHLPWEATVRGGILQGFLGPVFLLLPISVLALRDSLSRRIVVAALVFSIPFAANVGTRFLLPALPLWALAMGLALSRWPRAMLAVLAIHLLTALPPVAILYATPGVAMLDSIPIRAALRMVPEQETLQRLSPAYDVARIVEEHVPPVANVLAMAWVMEAYTSSNIRTHHLSAANERLAQTLWTPVTPGLEAGRRLTFHFPPQSLRALRIVLTASAEAERIALRTEPGFILDRPRVARDEWGIAELRLLIGNKELKNRPAQKVTAEPNGWDANLMTDNNPTTAWKTWQTARSGMWVQLEMDAAVVVDTIRMESPNAQGRLSFRLEKEDGSGRWSPLQATSTESLHTLEADLRRCAVAALRREGINYLLVDPTVAGAQDIRERAEEWDLRFVARALNGVCLYRLLETQGQR